MILSLALTLLLWSPCEPADEIRITGAVYERHAVYPFAPVSVPIEVTAAWVEHRDLAVGAVLIYEMHARRGECWST